MINLPFFIAELATEVLRRHADRELRNQLLDVSPPAGAPTLEEAPVARPGQTPGPLNARAIAVARALGEWKLDIEEPPGKNWQRIDKYIRGDGLGWPSAALVGSHDTRDYRRNGQFQWCGAFAAWAWAAVDFEIRHHHFASTGRLERWARGTARWLSPEDCDAGDLLLVGPISPKTKRPKTAHITLVTGPMELDAGVRMLPTVEGNASGPGPDGERHEGVIKRHRPLEAPDPKVYRGIGGVRMLAQDMDGR